MPNAEKSISLENATDVSAGLTSKEVSDRIAQGKVNGDFNIPSKSIKQIFKDNCLTFFNLINIILAAFVVAVGSFKNCLFLGVIMQHGNRYIPGNTLKKSHRQAGSYFCA